MTATIPFTLSNLKHLAARINADPSLIEDDWRGVMTQTFALDEQRGALLASLDAEDEGARREELQQAFGAAAAEIRGGASISFVVIRHAGTGRRSLHFVLSPTPEAGQRTAHGFDDEDVPTGGSTGIVCCCADCSNWHWCWRRNPCAATTTPSGGS